MKITLVIVVILSSLAFGACPSVAPVITAGPTFTATSPTGGTVTWTTDVNSTSMVMWGYANDDGFGQGMTSRADLGGVTNHSVTVTGIWPSTFLGQVRSECPSDFTKNVFASVSMVPSVDTGSAYDYVMTLAGAKHVYQASPLYIAIELFRVSGALDAGNQTFNITVQNLPTNAVLSIPTVDNCGGTPTLVGTTITRYPDCGKFDIKLDTTSTPTGTYNMNFHVTTVGGVPAARDYPWTVVVDPAATFSTGTPSAGSYAAIPCLTSSSKQTDGTSACAFNWQSTMLTYGANFCTQSYTVGPAIEEQKIWYYDEKNTMFQIKQYDTDHSLTGNPSQWDACIANGNTYRTYVIANNGTTRAYYVFPNGLYKDWAINGDTTSKSAVLLLGSGSSPYTNLDQGGLARAIYAREAAYRLNAEIFNYKAGDTSRTAYMAKAVDINIARADQWVTSGTAEYIQPFMVGLWAQALITCYDDPVCTGYHDARIGASIKKVADYLWTNAWNLSLFPNAFYYNSAQSAAGQAASPGSDYRVLNNLISPMYAWLFKTTGNTTYRDEANTIFQNGVLLNPVGGGAGETGKSFNENYRWSFDFVTWMSDPNPPVVKPIVGVSVR